MIIIIRRFASGETSDNLISFAVSIMHSTILQVPIDKKIRDRAVAQAREMGFSSLQESVRVFLKQLADRSLRVRFEPTVRLSAKNERRYAKMTEDFRKGRNIFSAHSVDELLDNLDRA